MCLFRARMGPPGSGSSAPDYLVQTADGHDVARWQDLRQAPEFDA
ncbi:MAG: hypothetical protein WCI67_04990 [Chloroflexales bacterium]